MDALTAALAMLAASPAAAQSTPTAAYDVVFDATWSEETHPGSLPPVPHFSPLIGGTHDDSVVFWQTGALASDGIENMAELGATSTLASEINAEIVAGSANQVVSGGGIALSPGSVGLSFTAFESYPRLTLVSMVAPSPDWFVGVSSLPLVQNGEWVEQLVIDLHVYDAGTDSGTTFTSPDADTNPAEPIAVFDTGPFAGDMQYVGTYTITRTDTPPPPPPMLPALGANAVIALAGALLVVGLAIVRRGGRTPRAAA